MILLCDATDDVDTRAITRRLRQDGSLIGVLSTDNTKTDEQLLQMSKSWDIVGKYVSLSYVHVSKIGIIWMLFHFPGVDLISGVSCKSPHEWADKTKQQWEFSSGKVPGETFHVRNAQYAISTHFCGLLGNLY